MTSFRYKALLLVRLFLFNIGKKIAMQSNSYSQNLNETGRVVDVSDEYVWVETQRKSACGSCQNSAGCGTGSLSKLFVNDKPALLKVPKTFEVKVGDHVHLSIDKQFFIQQIFLAYGLPLIGFFAGAVIFEGLTASFLIQGELLTIVGGIIGLFGGWWGSKKLYRPVLPKIVKVENFN